MYYCAINRRTLHNLQASGSEVLTFFNRGDSQGTWFVYASSKCSHRNCRQRIASSIRFKPSYERNPSIDFPTLFIENFYFYATLTSLSIFLHTTWKSPLIDINATQLFLLVFNETENVFMFLDNLFRFRINITSWLECNPLRETKGQLGIYNSNDFSSSMLQLDF